MDESNGKLNSVSITVSSALIEPTITQPGARKVLPVVQLHLEGTLHTLAVADAIGFASLLNSAATEAAYDAELHNALIQFGQPEKTAREFIATLRAMRAQSRNARQAAAASAQQEPKAPAGVMPFRKPPRGDA